MYLVRPILTAINIEPICAATSRERDVIPLTDSRRKDGVACYIKCVNSVVSV
jgi:hypothetical protein